MALVADCQNVTIITCHHHNQHDVRLKWRQTAATLQSIRPPNQSGCHDDRPIVVIDIGPNEILSN